MNKKISVRYMKCVNHFQKCKNRDIKNMKDIYMKDVI